MIALVQLTSLQFLIKGVNLLPAQHDVALLTALTR